MGKRGPKPKPTALKVLHGNPGRRPLNEDEPTPDELSEDPKPPAWLIAAAKREWKRIVPELRSVGLLTNLDLSTLAAYCQAWARFLDADAQLKKNGSTITLHTQAGDQQVPSPYVNIAIKWWKEAKSLASEFGFTPSARTNLKVQKSRPKDKLKAFVDQRRQA